MAWLEKETLEKRLGYVFQNPLLLKEALTHPGAGGTAFQRLEFLGDRVLGLVISHWLYEAYPHEHEGDLAKRFSTLVRRQALCDVAGYLELDAFVIRESRAPFSHRVLADTCEALIGALYLDGGLEQAKGVIRVLWAPLFWDFVISRDAKTLLQEKLQAIGYGLPVYELMHQEGPPHAPVFSVYIHILPEERSFLGQGHSKREAEQRAAEKALTYYTS